MGKKRKRLKKKQKKKQMLEKRRKQDFCIPQRGCPERAKNPELPSPESCLPPEQREEVDRKIAEANRLLLDLALDDDRPIQETYQRAFDGLIGMEVEIANPLGNPIFGVVKMAAFDFVLLCGDDENIILPYGQVESIQTSGHYTEILPEAELQDIGPRLRRKLTFQFGKVVGSSPELIQLFFRIPLVVYLLLFQEQAIKVRVGKSLIEGVLVDVDKESIKLHVNKESSIIPIENIGYIHVPK